MATPVRPNLFDWIVPDQVAACVHPAYGTAVVEHLRAASVTLLVNLHDQPDNPYLLADLGATALHLPVPDFAPPTPEQLDAGITAIRQALAEGRRVAVHCAAGLGRTGTLLAAYFVTEGLDPAAAIQRVRDVRPGSVEAPEQEAAVFAYAAARR